MKRNGRGKELVFGWFYIPLSWVGHMGSYLWCMLTSGKMAIQFVFEV